MGVSQLGTFGFEGLRLTAAGGLSGITPVILLFSTLVRCAGFKGMSLPVS